MLDHSSTRRLPISLTLLALGISLSGCVSGAERRQAHLQEDTSTCATFGSSYGSRAYSDCMVAQQRRRDVAQLESLEKTRMTTEIARNAQIMADRARADRCRRDPDRRECGR